jgi:hypothetical protein
LLSKNIKIRIIRVIILSFVLQRCETWPPTLKEEHRLSELENMVLRKIFGLTRDEVTGLGEATYSEASFYSAPNLFG